VIFICGEIKDLVSESDKHCAYLEDPDDIDLNGEFDGVNEDEAEGLKRKYALPLFVFCLFCWHTTVPSWERSHAAVRELCRLIPNFQKKIDEGSPEELSEFYAEVSSVLVDIGAFTYWIGISFSMVPMALVVTTWVGFVHASQIGWTRPTLAPLPY
jgi:hypothetical protein